MTLAIVAAMPHLEAGTADIWLVSNAPGSADRSRQRPHFIRWAATLLSKMCGAPRRAALASAIAAIVMDTHGSGSDMLKVIHERLCSVTRSTLPMMRLLQC